MRNDIIGEVLKKYRKANGLEIHDVSILLKERYGLDIADKTIYGWESNQAHPVTDTFVALCEMYHIADVGKEFSTDPTPVSSIVTMDEFLLLTSYRELPEPMQKKILQTVQEKSKQMKTIKTRKNVAKKES